MARPTPQRRDLLRGDPGRLRCGWWRPLAAPRRHSRQYNPRQRPSGPCSLRRRLCSRSTSTKVNPWTRSRNGASPKSRRGDTQLNGSSPPRRGPYDAWAWWAARSTRPTSAARSTRPTSAAAALTAHDGVQRVTALVRVLGGSKAAPTVAILLQALHCSKTSLAVPVTSLQGVVRTERQPWETADLEVVDPSPPWHVLQLVWERLPEDDEREAAELPDIDPGRWTPCRPRSGSSAFWTRLSWRMPSYAGSTWGLLARTTPGGISSRSWGRLCPTPRPCRQQSGGRKWRSLRISRRRWRRS